MTVTFSEVPDNTKFLIKSGAGFFVRFNGNSPYMVSTPILASTFNYYEALGIMIEFEKLGFQAELIIEPGR